MLLRTVVVCLLLGSPALRAQEPMGKFGPYHWINKQLRLPGGDTLTVYRVKIWQFGSGQPQALQLEYESRASVADVAAVRHQLDLVWPAFVPYVEAMHMTAAIVTATNLVRSGAPPQPWTAQFKSFGHTMKRGPDGQWRVTGEPTDSTLPPSLGADKFLIYEATGALYRPDEPPTSDH